MEKHMLTWLAMASHFCFYFVWMASISICTYCKQDAFCCYLHLAQHYHNISQRVEIANALTHSVSNGMHGQLHGDTKVCYEKKKWPNLLPKRLSCQRRNMLICQSDTTRKLKQRSSVIQKSHSICIFPFQTSTPHDRAIGLWWQQLLCLHAETSAWQCAWPWSACSVSHLP